MEQHDLAVYRAEFPITERYAFLSHAAVSPLNRRAAEATRAHIEQAQSEPLQRLFASVMQMYVEFRERLATLVNARSAEEIVAMPNTATAINTVAMSLPLHPGDNVLVLDGDYPANVYPWMNLAYRGVLTRMVPQREGGLDLPTLEQRIDNRTRAIAVSTVMFATGFHNDIAALGRLCHERNIYFIVDGIQSLGAFPLDVQACHIDFLAAGSQKWLLSAPGSGFLYCRQERLEELVPGAYVGASSVVDPYNFLDYNLTFPPDASRFNVGTPNFLGMTALHATLGLLFEVGINRIHEHVSGLVDTLIDDLQARGYHLAASTTPEHRSGIVVAHVPGADPEALCARLEEEGVIVTTRGGGVRIAPHFYNTRDEVLRVGELLDRYRSA